MEWAGQGVNRESHTGDMLGKAGPATAGGGAFLELAATRPAVGTLPGGTPARVNGLRDDRMANDRPVALVDGSNVAYSTEGGKPAVANLLAMQQKLAEDGFEPIILVDAALRHSIDDSSRFEQLVDAGAVRQAPAGTDADYFILSFARELDAAIVSNDRFRDRIQQFPEVHDRIIRYMILNGEVVLERRTQRRG
jgi:hypothetical protein